MEAGNGRRLHLGIPEAVFVVSSRYPASSADGDGRLPGVRAGRPFPLASGPRALSGTGTNGPGRELPHPEGKASSVEGAIGRNLIKRCQEGNGRYRMLPLGLRSVPGPGSLGETGLKGPGWVRPDPEGNVWSRKGISGDSRAWVVGRNLAKWSRRGTSGPGRERRVPERNVRPVVGSWAWTVAKNRTKRSRKGTA